LYYYVIVFFWFLRLIILSVSHDCRGRAGIFAMLPQHKVDLLLSSIQEETKLGLRGTFRIRTNQQKWVLQAESTPLQVPPGCASHVAVGAFDATCRAVSSGDVDREAKPLDRVPAEPTARPWRDSEIQIGTALGAAVAV
jgi:hypothetical protein